MKVTMDVEVADFMVPNFVRVLRPPGHRQDGFKLDDSSISIADLDAVTLDRLCANFREAVFKKAGKTPPE